MTNKKDLRFLSGLLIQDIYRRPKKGGCFNKYNEILKKINFQDVLIPIFLISQVIIFY